MLPTKILIIDSNRKYLIRGGVQRMLLNGINVNHLIVGFRSCGHVVLTAVNLKFRSGSGIQGLGTMSCSHDPFFINDGSTAVWAHFRNIQETSPWELIHVGVGSTDDTRLLQLKRYFQSFSVTTKYTNLYSWAVTSFLVPQVQDVLAGAAVVVLGAAVVVFGAAVVVVVTGAAVVVTGAAVVVGLGARLMETVQENLKGLYGL